ncbi:MAG: DUF4288 domain-containing protein [Gemmataceae bacterium]|nr:DUF4288 domain-containing protein [Gemmataceae bacterium]
MVRPKATDDAVSHWYAAHILMYVKRKKPAAGPISVWENIVLIKADSEEEAFAKAERQTRRRRRGRHIPMGWSTCRMGFRRRPQTYAVRGLG